MMKKLFLMLILASQVSTAQDANYLKNGVNYPIWFSKTKFIIARPKIGTPEEEVLSAFRKYNLRIDAEDKDSDINYYLTGALVNNNPFEACEKLDATGQFEFTQPNYLRFIELAGNPNDPLFASNWGLAKMKLPEAWDITTGYSNIKIAIIDDGVQLNHELPNPMICAGKVQMDPRIELMWLLRALI